MPSSEKPSKSTQTVTESPATKPEVPPHSEIDLSAQLRETTKRILELAKAHAGFDVSDAPEEDFVDEIVRERTEKNPDFPALVEKRRQEKAASRAEDQRQLDAGEITAEELRVRNGSFAFPRDQVTIHFPELKGKRGK